MSHPHGAPAPELSASPTVPFSTDRLSLAAYLLALGHKPTPRPASAGIVLFEFADPVAEDVRSFYNGRASVAPLDYDAARIAVRRMMDAAKGGAR